MTKVTLKGLAMHKTRAVLTTLAVVIGVAMISGAYVVSDTMLSAAKSLSSAAYDNTDAVVTKKLFPVTTLISFVLIAVIAGTLAAIMPARRASRLDVLNALQYV